MNSIAFNGENRAHAEPPHKPGRIGATLRTGLCDAAAAFPATQGPVLSEWINYTGCDSLFAAAADSFVAYIGGHERWSMNNNNCDAMGDGIAAPGMEGSDPPTGNLLLNLRVNGLAGLSLLPYGS